MADIEHGRRIYQNETGGLSRRTFLKAYAGAAAVMLAGSSIDYFYANSSLSEKKRLLQQTHPYLSKRAIDQELRSTRIRLTIDRAFATYGALTTIFYVGTLLSENATIKVK